MQDARIIEENLILEDEYFIVEGDLTITGNKLVIRNACLIVSGDLMVECPVYVKGGDIVASNIAFFEDIFVQDGDICAMHGDLDANNIYTDGNIEVANDCSTDNITCLNLLVNGSTDVKDIIAMQDVYIMGDNNSFNIIARDVFVGENSYFESHLLKAKSYECIGDTFDCAFMSIG